MVRSGFLLAKRITMLAISLMYTGGRAVARLLAGGGRGTTTVLTYHAVGEGDLERFERQMATLPGLSTPVFADAAASHGRRQVAVTFDDAFQHVFDRALPVLKRYEIPATIFAPTGYLGTEPGWIPESVRSSRALGPVASADTLASVDRRLVRLGSHTVTHPRLAAVDDASLVWELTTSKQALEALAGDRVAMIALPYGSCGREVVGAAARAGYDHVFANVPVSSDPSSILLGRTDVSPRDWPIEFRLKVRGGYEWMALAVPAKRHVLQFLGRPQEA